MTEATEDTKRAHFLEEAIVRRPRERREGKNVLLSCDLGTPRSKETAIDRLFYGAIVKRGP